MLRLTTSQVAADSRSHDLNFAGKRNLHRVSGLVQLPDRHRAVLIDRFRWPGTRAAGIGCARGFREGSKRPGDQGSPVGDSHDRRVLAALSPLCRSQPTPKTASSGIRCRAGAVMGKKRVFEFPIPRFVNQIAVRTPGGNFSAGGARVR